MPFKKYCFDKKCHIKDIILCLIDVYMKNDISINKLNNTIHLKRMPPIDRKKYIEFTFECRRRNHKIKDVIETLCTCFMNEGFDYMKRHGVKMKKRKIFHDVKSNEMSLKIKKN